MKKYEIVITKNSFYFSNSEFEENYEANIINLLKTLLLHLQNEVKNKGCKESVFVEFLQDNEFGLESLLVLNGIANENLKRIITIARIVNDRDLSTLLYLHKWNDTNNSNDIKEWGDKKIKTLIRKNESFAKGLINLFLKAHQIHF